MTTMIRDAFNSIVVVERKILVEISDVCGEENDANTKKAAASNDQTLPNTDVYVSALMIIPQ